QFAALYDRLMAHAPYHKWVQFTEDIIHKHALHVNNIVDLGCGTGEITVRLKELGYHITGVDVSEDMLAIANAKALHQHQSVTFVHQDIRNLEGFDHIDLCVSYCDVMNYITDMNDIEQVFQKVYNCLSNHGTFIFDVHHLPYVEEYLVNHSFSDVTDELAYIWECEAADQLGGMNHYLTFFEQQSDNSYHRFDEHHYQQTQSLAIYEKLLKNVGYTKITFYNDFQMQNEKIENNSERIFIIAEK